MESKSVASVETSESLKLPPVILRKELHTLIGTVKEMQLVTTYQEVLEGLKIYIVQNKLFDPQNPYKVCCKNDELGSVLGADEFNVYELKTFLPKLIFPVSKTYRDSAEATVQSASENSAKRKIDENNENGQKKVCNNVPDQSTSPMILHIPPSPIKCDSSDSLDSVQGYETAFVKDTSDDVRSLEQSPRYFTPEEGILAIEETFDLEYEVETDSSDFTVNSCDSSDSDSEIDIAAAVALDAAILTFVCRTDSDIEFFADDSSDEEDAEISKSDNWKCGRCHFLNRPTMRCCSKCWQERSEWLPEKNQREFLSPPRKRRKQKKSKSSVCNREIFEKDEDEMCLKASSQDCSADEGSSSKCTQDSQGSSTDFECFPEIKESSSAASETGPSSWEALQKQCIICCAKPANASIIHGKYAHQISCYKCARKLQKQKKRCPICRRTIDKVVYQITNV